MGHTQLLDQSLVVGLHRRGIYAELRPPRATKIIEKSFYRWAVGASVSVTLHATVITGEVSTCAHGSTYPYRVMGRWPSGVAVISGKPALPGWSARVCRHPTDLWLPSESILDTEFYSFFVAVGDENDPAESRWTRFEFKLPRWGC